jgi:hypothetical protein
MRERLRSRAESLNTNRIGIKHQVRATFHDAPAPRADHDASRGDFERRCSSGAEAGSRRAGADARSDGAGA